MSDKSHLLEPRYNQQILIAEKHLQTKAKGKGSKINKERTDYLVKIGAQCPICGIRFEGGNHNTEHIFPSGLGGENKNHNKIQMCVACNSARNQILQLLGHPPWYDRYPENFEHVKKVLIWCLITVEDGIHSGKQVSEIHDKFMQYRTGGQEFPNKPTKSFGPASTWVVGDNPNYLHNHSPNSRTQSTKAPTTSLTLTVFDWIFGYKSRDTTKPKKVETRTIETEPEDQNLRIKYVTTKSGLRLPRNPTIFANIIVWLTKNILDYEDHAACRDAIKQAGITSNTPVPLLLALYKVFDEEQQFEAASKHISASTPLQLCKDFCEFYSKNKISGMDPAPELSEIKEGLTEYMNAAISHLSPQKKLLED